MTIHIPSTDAVCIEPIKQGLASWRTQIEALVCVGVGGGGILEFEM